MKAGFELGEATYASLHQGLRSRHAAAELLADVAVGILVGGHVDWYVLEDEYTLRVCVYE